MNTKTQLTPEQTAEVRRQTKAGAREYQAIANVLGIDPETPFCSHYEAAPGHRRDSGEILVVTFIEEAGQEEEPTTTTTTQPAPAFGDFRQEKLSTCTSHSTNGGNVYIELLTFGKTPGHLAELTLYIEPAPAGATYKEIQAIVNQAIAAGQPIGRAYADLDANRETVETPIDGITPEIFRDHERAGTTPAADPDPDAYAAQQERDADEDAARREEEAGRDETAPERPTPAAAVEPAPAERYQRRSHYNAATWRIHVFPPAPGIEHTQRIQALKTGAALRGDHTVYIFQLDRSPDRRRYILRQGETEIATIEPAGAEFIAHVYNDPDPGTIRTGATIGATIAGIVDDIF